MKYLSTILVLAGLVALVFGFAYNLTSMAPQFPQLETMSQHQPPKVVAKKVHHHRRKLASMALLPSSQDQDANSDATSPSNAKPASDTAAKTTTQASVDPESLAVERNASADGQDSHMDDVPMN